MVFYHQICMPDIPTTLPNSDLFALGSTTSKCNLRLFISRNEKSRGFTFEDANAISNKVMISDPWALKLLEEERIANNGYKKELLIFAHGGQLISKCDTQSGPALEKEMKKAVPLYFDLNSFASMTNTLTIKFLCEPDRMLLANMDVPDHLPLFGFPSHQIGKNSILPNISLHSDYNSYDDKYAAHQKKLFEWAQSSCRWLDWITTNNFGITTQRLINFLPINIYGSNRLSLYGSPLQWLSEKQRPYDILFVESGEIDLWNIIQLFHYRLDRYHSSLQIFYSKYCVHACRGVDHWKNSLLWLMRKKKQTSFYLKKEDFFFKSRQDPIYVSQLLSRVTGLQALIENLKIELKQIKNEQTGFLLSQGIVQPSKDRVYIKSQNTHRYSEIQKKIEQIVSFIKEYEEALIYAQWDYYLHTDYQKALQMIDKKLENLINKNPTAYSRYLEREDIKTSRNTSKIDNYFAKLDQNLIQAEIMEFDLPYDQWLETKEKLQTIIALEKSKS